MTREVCVLEGYGLPESDLGYMGDHSDPFVALALGAERHVSPVVNDSLDPVWNWCVELTPPAQSELPELVFQVFDHDQFTAQDLLGTASVRTPLDVDSDRWVALNPTGRIHVRVRVHASARNPSDPSAPPTEPAAALTPLTPKPSDGAYPTALPEPVADDPEQIRMTDWPAAQRFEPMPAPASIAVATGARSADASSGLANTAMTPAGTPLTSISLVFVLAIALVALILRWGRLSPRAVGRSSTQLLEVGSSRADGDFKPTSIRAVELVQAIPYGADGARCDATEHGDEPPGYPTAGKLPPV
jgi:hypothetical protein